MVITISFVTLVKNNSNENRNNQLLPILKFIDSLTSVIKKINILIVCGETGSGKSTKLTQIFIDQKLFKVKLICCTQPRRIAVIKLATRVAKERKYDLGGLVGYAIRFEEKLSNKTKIKYCTDGILIKECFKNSILSEYSSIIIDEAHERTINTDILLGICKQIVKSRLDFKLIISSATLNVKKFSLFLNKCPVFLIPGKIFNVNIFYLKKFTPKYIELNIHTILKVGIVNSQIYKKSLTGDILSFLTGRNEIEFTCCKLSKIINTIETKNKKIKIFPFFSNLPLEKQTIIFQQKKNQIRKCIISTNITETSLTIPGIKFVIDSGYYKCKIYNPNIHLEVLCICPISKASANQRSGRAGRIENGVCYRLYTERIYLKELKSTSVPEIKRSSLTSLVLTLKSLDIENVSNFDFIDKPSSIFIFDALEQLFRLGAINKKGDITNLGLLLSFFPVEIKMGKVLLTSVFLKCCLEVSVIIGIISTNSSIFFDRLFQELIRNKTTNFSVKIGNLYGDHLVYLEIYKEWVKHKYSQKWCTQKLINVNSLNNAKKISKQLLKNLRKFQLTIKCIKSSKNNICKAFTSGFYRNSAKKINNKLYKVIEGKKLYPVYSRSFNINDYPEWIIFHEIIKIEKEYLCNVCKTDPTWIRKFYNRN